MRPSESCYRAQSRVVEFPVVCLFVHLPVYLSTACPDASFLSPQLWYEPRPRAELPVELWSEAAEIWRQENTASTHPQEG